MKSYGNIGNVSSAEAISADDITELHAARILMLFRLCGTGPNGRIDGLTKLAKLDFFVRYPSAFDRIAEHLTAQKPGSHIPAPAPAPAESPMIRHHYGPWDKRYYQVLPFLEARKLITVKKEGDAFIFELTELGNKLAKSVEKSPEHTDQATQMRRVKKLLGPKSGNSLKNLIYEVFTEEVTNRPLGQVIR